ncbi:Eukaryotic translation initiation factor 5A-2 [Tetrabaena socialis]|uniref:Eukaryotic translation initiation factor 5A n=1 Tax=Tetrabaena socialis TaxID=47790 RepID=A0A2J7ZXJ6_9CHLO|nr:Eukaryotic translation initiation factor 5A-2 [Tetrabaena socialis]|eukprot:PNH05000.1 Eukaryotic translation initiation factor 5A-2 [Tetrabaena socialis]
MSDHEVETFDSADAGASLTYPQQAGTVRKNGHMVIQGHPCKVVDVSTSKTGKHGHAKCNFTAVDIFTSKKYEDICPSSHNVDVPNISRKEYTCIDVTDEGVVSLMEENGTVRDDLFLPKGTEDADKLSELILQLWEEQKEMSITVVKAMGIEMIMSLKVVTEK